MCTVSLITRQNGYCLGMNRDEQRSRVEALPPKRRSIGGRTAIHPTEPGGGTWIAVNDLQITLALINWYSVSASAGPGALSRGEIIPAAVKAGAPAEVEGILRALSLSRINPFRLIGVFPAAREIVEWRWDLNRLGRRRHRWKSRQWISSGFDEPRAERVRSTTFREAQKQKSAGTLAWLRRLHRSHSPHAGPFSTCMHRNGAATVSYTEIVARHGNITMRYQAGASCEAGTLVKRIAMRGQPAQPSRGRRSKTAFGE